MRVRGADVLANASRERTKADQEARARALGMSIKEFYAHRMSEMARQHGEGRAVSEIAQEWGLSRTRVDLILRKAARLAEGRKRREGWRP